MKVYLRIMSFARPFRRFLPFLAITTFLSVIFQLLNLSFLSPILKVLFSESGAQGQALPAFPQFHFSLDFFAKVGNWGKAYLLSFDNKADALGLICLVLICSVFLANLFVFLSRFILANVKAKLIKNIRVTVYNKLQDMHLGYFTNENRGDLISRMTNDVQEVESSMVATINAMVKEPVTIIITFVTLFYLSPKLVLFSLLVLPVSALAIGKLTSLLRKKAKQGQSYLAKIMGTIEETLRGIKIIQSFNAQRHFKNKFLHENEKYERTLRSIDYKKGLASPLSQFLGVTVFCALLFYGGKLVLEEKYMPPENFLVFVLLFANVIAPLKSLFSVIANMQRGLVAGTRIFKVLDEKSLIQDKSDAIDFKKFQNEIELQDLVFRYEEQNVLDHFSFKVKKGMSVALVGPSGAGKSTIINLVPRFYDVIGGAIKIDGVDIRDIKLQDLRNLFGTVTQDSILFNDTIYNNIAFGISSSVKEEDVIEAAKIANAHEFIENTSNGYQTVIGDEGTKLSGGQKQRICIARAVLKNPPIMLLDEATSALDTESEKLVQDALTELMKNRTSIIVAHRLSTIKNADVILVIDNGKIIESGSHQELVNKEGLYNKLINMQNVSLLDED